MKKILSRRPSPAVIVAIAALVVALTGTAVAGGGFLTKKKFRNQAVRGPVQYVTTTINVPAVGTGRSYVAVSAACPSGTKVTGGGIKTPDPGNSGNVYVNDSYPTTGGWAGHVSNYATGGTTAATATAVAICATVKSSSGAPPSS